MRASYGLKDSTIRLRVENLILNKIKKIVVAQLNQGATPHGVALTCGVALSLGIFPILGTTTLLCLLAGQIFKLNQPLLISLNYILYPLQIIGIPIFIYAGESILGLQHLTINVFEMVQNFSKDWHLFLVQYGWAGVHAILAWMLITPFVGMAVYFALLPLFKRTKINRV